MSNDNYLRCSCKECGNHIEFPDSSAGTVTACPHCGQWTELIADAPPIFEADKTLQSTSSNKKFPVLAILLGIIVMTVVAGGFFFLRSRSKTAAASPAPPPTKVVAIPTNPLPAKAVPAKPAVTEKPQKSLDDLKVSPVQLEKSKVGSLVYAVGTVTNASDFQRFGVKIELELLNQKGKNIGTATDYKDVIEPNHQWQFHALIFDSRTVSAKVSSLKED